MSVSEHLSISQVRAYVRGALHPSTLVGIDDHLEACAACRAALARESDASFGAEAFARALAAPETRPESPHLGFEHLRGVVDDTLAPFDREWVAAHLALCVMCAEELRDLEKFAVTLPARPKPKPEPVVEPVPDDSARAEFTPASGRAPFRDAYATARVVPSRLSPRAEASDEPPSRYGQQPAAALPWWIKVAAGLSLLALVQFWAC